MRLPCASLLLAAAFVSYAWYNSAASSSTTPSAVASLMQQAILSTDGLSVGESFGNAVALSSDGDTAIVGAYMRYGARGAAYIFTRDGAIWNQQAELRPDDDAYFFASAVAMSGDGNIVVIGAPATNNAAVFHAGAAYVFVRNGAMWSQQARLVADDPQQTALLGSSVAMSADGDIIVLGTLQGDAAYAFARNADGTYAQQQKILPADGVGIIGSAYGKSGFGTEVALSRDGHTTVVLAPSKTRAGSAAYVFTRDDVAWSQQAVLFARDSGSGDGLGRSVSISADGGSIAINGSFKAPPLPGATSSPTIGPLSFTSIVTRLDGSTAVVSVHRTAPIPRDPTIGAVFVFTRDGGAWAQQARLTAQGDTGYDGNIAAVAISDDGSTVVFGAPGKNQRGAIYAFAGTGAAWDQQAELFASDGGPVNLFGDSIAVNGDGSTVAVGADYKDGHKGAAYIFATVTPSAVPG